MCRRKVFRGLTLLVWSLLILTLPVTAANSAANGVRINEILFNPGAGAHQWVEIKNAGATAVSVAGYLLSNETGGVYEIPAALPAVPVGAFVVVVFDGLGNGADDYDFSDNVATLHTGPGLVDIFGKTAGQAALYTGQLTLTTFLPLIGNLFQPWNPPIPQPPRDFAPPAIISFVAWGGAPGDRALNASLAGLWSIDWFKSTFRGLGTGDPSEPPLPNETIGLVPGSVTAYPGDWTLYPANPPGQVTPGSENPVPVITWFYPPSGATVRDTTFIIGWNAVEKAIGYRFQLDNNSDFSSLIVNQDLTNPFYQHPGAMAQGTYYWRVQVLFPNGVVGPPSNGMQINSLTFPAGGPLQAVGALGIPWQLQHKDTKMLCLDGCNMTGAANAWDSEHATRGAHGNNYCVRATISMMHSNYNAAKAKTLSQDRITYELFKGGPPEGDIGHDKPTATFQQITDLLTWALGTAPLVQLTRPTYAQIQTWINTGRPIGSRVPGHIRVIDGYFDFDLLGTHYEFVHVLDPWDNPKWVRYSDDNTQQVWVGPATAPTRKSDEATLTTDSDGDGVYDFDETNRFHTDPIKADTDNDLVPDKLDILGYVFLPNGTYSWINPDIDGDTKRKELDPDNDNANDLGLMDGCEDTNHDGILQAASGETSNFRPSDDRTMLITLSWPTLGADVDLHLVRPNGSMWTGDDCYYSNRNPDWGQTGLNCDDPLLDVDCITQCTVEHINLNKLENGTYSLKVHYFSDHGKGPTTATITVWLQGALRSFSSQLSDDQTWDVCTIDWPSKTITLGGGVTSMPLRDRRTLPGK